MRVVPCRREEEKEEEEEEKGTGGADIGRGRGSFAVPPLLIALSPP
jgi:hypothetical protein